MFSHGYRRFFAALPLLALLLTAATSPALAGTYFKEGFNGSWSYAPPGWSYSNSSAYFYSGNGNWIYPCYTYPGPMEGDAYCYFDSYSFYSGSWCEITSPAFNMSAATQGRIGMQWYRGSGYSSYLNIEISSDNGASWTYLGSFNDGSCSWEYRAVSVPAAFWTSNVRIRLTAYADWWAHFSMDDLIVDDGSVPILYCGAGSWDDAYYAGIENVNFAGIDNWTSYFGVSGGYSFYPDPTPTVMGGANYDLSVYGESYYGYYQYIYCWIDWNQNGSFYDSGEEYYVGYVYGDWASIPINIPSTATPGVTRMRIRTVPDWWGYPGPCDYIYGETEDYQINIVLGDAPKIELTPASMTFQAEMNGALPPAQTLTIKNVGADKPMDWSGTTIASPAPSWLTLGPPISGSVPGYNQTNTTPIRPNRTNLPATLPYSTYTGTAHIVAPMADNSPQDVNVTYEITPAAHINIGTSIITVKVLYKKPVQSKKIYVMNSGGMFNGGSMSWSVSTTTPWISFVGATSGLQDGYFTILVDPGLNMAGTYTGSVTLTAENSVTRVPADNSPMTVQVNMEIEPDQNFTQSKVITTPGTYVYTNGYDHKIAEVKLNSGSLGTLTVNMFPGQLPQGTSRLRYVRRYFTFESTNRSFNINLKMYYTGSEAALGGVTRHELLTGWRQPVWGGAWQNMGGSSVPLENYVQVSNVTNLDGSWVCASPWYPKPVTLASFTAMQTGSSDVAVEWKSKLVMSDEGFILQRASLGASDWADVAVVPSTIKGEYSVVDRDVPKGVYQYQVIGLDREGNELASQIVVLSVGETPRELALVQNYPNPFNGTTSIDFALPENGRVTLTIHNLVGQEVARVINAREMPAGSHSVSFVNTNLDPGTYLYRLDWNGRQITKRMTIIR